MFKYLQVEQEMIAYETSLWKRTNPHMRIWLAMNNSKSVKSGLWTPAHIFTQHTPENI